MAGKGTSRTSTPAVCPVCGDDVPARALACPGCGADERSGWREDPADDGGWAEEFDYDEFVKDEFGTRVKPAGLTVFWWITAIVVIVALAFVLSLQGRF